ncbi:GyrI-like domain-containing protein [Nocardioides daphniae]|uniref:Transcriptional regulator n=1 Tax=Nocardioides daphniae TaxID=402297 RepID=A0A4P7U8T8_9ACTN|nr:GyrI-like domain-containing protein [Nocardioides daphniae]QCC76500.1 AraC family transcriptional regulator [Nocardioides daphniae]GGD06101.1 transcriptional regulator [Nocardioides daphniae]
MSARPVPLVLSTEPFTTPTQVDLPDDVVVVLLRHECVTMEEIVEIFDGGFTVLSGLEPIGPGFACYDGDVSATFDLTLGFPVGVHAQGLPADLPDGVEHGKFPDGPAWVVSHRGAYDGLPEAWAGLLAAVGAEGAEDGSRFVEIYVDDPSRTAPEELRTDLVLLPASAAKL